MTFLNCVVCFFSPFFYSHSCAVYGPFGQEELEDLWNKVSESFCKVQCQYALVAVATQDDYLQATEMSVFAS